MRLKQVETQSAGRVVNALRTKQRDHDIWITAGLGCDGESVALTAATQPSVEDIVMGGMLP